MYIYIDTNAFYNNWFLDKASFKLLFNYIENTDAQLIISEVVVLEAENIRARELHHAISTIEGEIRKARKLIQKDVEIDITTLHSDYSLKEELKKKVYKVLYVPFHQISHQDVVDRTLRIRRPFQDNEKGYRDTLIWLSLLHFLKEKDNKEEVIFISNNKDDFYKSKEISFHDHLVEDIKEFGLNCTITPYESLHSFIKARVDLTKHEFGYEEVMSRFIFPFEEVIEDEIEWYLTTLPTPVFRNLLSGFGYELPLITTLLNFDFDIIEGIEDLSIVEHKKLPDKSIYINVKFNLRICAIKLTIPITEFYQNQHAIENVYSDFEVKDDEASFDIYVRPYFSVAVNYNSSTDDIEGFEVLDIHIRKQ